MDKYNRIRCKFEVQKVADLAWREIGGRHIQEVTMCAIYAESVKTAEDMNFAVNTPTGVLTFTVTNPYVIGTIKPGEVYYLDLEKVPDDYLK